VPDNRQTLEDRRAGEQRFAQQLLRAVRAKYDVKWTDGGGFLIGHPIDRTLVRISNVSFVDNPGQAADALKKLIDADEARRMSAYRFNYYLSNYCNSSGTDIAYLSS
jgi:hypothetical protein